MRQAARAGLSALLALALVWSSGCRREFLYAPQTPPRVQAGHVLVERPGEEARLYAIDRVQVVRVSGEKGDPTAAELKAIREGAVEDVDALSFSVDTNGEVWRDYAVPWSLGGFVLGAALAFLIAYSPGAEEGFGLAPERKFLFGAALALPLGLGVGLEGMGLGALIGAWATSGAEDMRGEVRP
jgi:hypothetical protein